MNKMPFKSLFVVLSFLLLLPASAMAGQDQEIGTSRWVIDDVIVGDTVPFAIGHRGYGVNLGEVPDNPIENTTKAVRRAFREGVQIVEVDANLTSDNVAAVLHDDFLPDLTCINTMTFKEIKKILPERRGRCPPGFGRRCFRRYPVHTDGRPGDYRVVLA